MMNTSKAFKLMVAAAGSILISTAGLSDIIITTQDGRTFTLPIEPHDIKSIEAAPAKDGSAAPGPVRQETTEADSAGAGDTKSTVPRLPVPKSKPSLPAVVESKPSRPAPTSKPSLPPASTFKPGTIVNRKSNSTPTSPSKPAGKTEAPAARTSGAPNALASLASTNSLNTPVRTPSVDTPRAFATFEERCNAPDVVFCDPLDTEGPWGVRADGKRHLLANDNGAHGIPTQTWWQHWRGVANRSARKVKGAAMPSLDRKIKASGTGSLKFVQPPFSNSSGGGAFTTNFSDDLSQTFGEGDTFFVQYRWRASCDFLYFDCDPDSPTYKTDRRFYRSSGGGRTAFKLSIIGTGDPAKGTSANSCTALETVLVHGADHILGGYHNCGWYSGFSAPVDPATSPIRAPGYAFDKQPGGAFTCPTNYGRPEVKMRWGTSSDTCFRLVSDQWMTIQIQISIGTWQPQRRGPNKNIPPNSNVKVWAAQEGEQQRLIVNRDLYLAGPAKPGGRFGKIWLLPYMTNKDDRENHPAAEVWYDELIVSRAFIANPK